MFFVSLQPEMKKIFMKYFAAVLALWYLLGVMGFTVHSCQTTGETFVISLLSGVSCEDVHPGDDCCEDGGCSCGHTQKGESTDCCSNEIEILDLPTVQSSSENNGLQDVDLQPVSMPCTEVSSISSYITDAFSNNCSTPDFEPIVYEGQAYLGVWRN